MSRRRDRRPVYDLPVYRPPVIVRPRLILRPIVIRRPPVNLDRRTFHPDGRFRPAPTLVRAARRLVVARPQKPRLSVSQLNHRIGFAIPKKVLICVRRKERREVIFARRGHGKGARSPKTRNIWSNVKC